MSDSVESLIDQFSQLNLGKMHSTISSSKEEGPDLKELYKKARSFRQRFKKLGSKKEEKKKLIEEIKDCISTAKFSPKNIDRVHEGIRRANPGVGELEPLDWILTLEILLREVLIHRIDFEDHDVTKKVKGLLQSTLRASSKPKKDTKQKKPKTKKPKTKKPKTKKPKTKKPKKPKTKKPKKPKTKKKPSKKKK